MVYYSVSSWVHGPSQCQIHLGPVVCCNTPSLQDKISNPGTGGLRLVFPMPISWLLASAATWSVSFHVVESKNWMNRKACDSQRGNRILEEWPACSLLFHIHEQSELESSPRWQGCPSKEPPLPCLRKAFIQQICYFPSAAFRRLGMQLTLSASSLAHPFLLD